MSHVTKCLPLLSCHYDSMSHVELRDNLVAVSDLVVQTHYLNICVFSGLEVRSLFSNWTALQGVLVHNMSLPVDDLRAVGNATVNMAEVR